MKSLDMKTYKNYYIHNQANGFSMLEVLISVLVLSIGLLGLAALHASSLKANHGAYHKSQATYLAYDIVDRMRANRPEAINESYDITLATGSLSGSTLAVTDVNNWLTTIAGLLPNGDGAIDCNAAGRCQVDVTWNVEREGGTADGSSTTTQQFTFITDV